MSLYSRLDRLATDVARLDRQLTSVSNHPQSQRTSVEGGSIDFNDSDGNLKAIVGEQDDGGNTINVISGPTPPTPVGFTVDVDHGKFIVHWSGDFDGDKLAPSDWSRAEVHASPDPFFVPDRTTARGSIVSAAGGEVTIGVLKGPWTIKMLAWSQAGKMSAPSAPVDVEVPGYGEIVLEEIDAAETDIKNGNSILVNAQDTLGTKLDSAFGSIDSINDDLSDLGDAVQGAVESANGKNTVHYEDHAPTPADEGTEGDTWFVGQVGRPSDVVEAVNEALNPSFTSLDNQMYTGQMYASAGTAAIVTSDWSESGDTALEIRPTSTNNTTAVDCITRGDTATAADAGRTITISANIHLPAAQTGSQWSNARRIIIRTSSGGSSNYSYALSDQAPNAAGSTRLSVTFTLPEQLDHWYFLLGNGSSSTRVYWDSLRIGGSIYFDGDTEDGATDDDPHYRWTGTPHASTSEKYLPATEGLSDNWNVVEQYRFQSGEWVQVELSHTVLSSLDLGKLVAGSAAIKEAVVQKLFAEVVVARMSVADEFIGENAILTGAVTAPKITASEELWAKLAQFVKVRAEHIESDAIDGMVVRGLTLIAGNDRHRLDDSGYALFDDDGDRRTFLSPEGSTFKGEVEAETFVANGGAELRGTNNTLAQGAKLTLAAGVTDPTAPPVVQPYWEGVEFTPPSDATPAGLAFDGTHYWTAESWPEVGAAWKIDADTGAAERVSLPVSWGRLFGVTCIGSELYWLTLASHTSKVIVTDLNLGKEREFEFEDIGFSSTNPLVYDPGIGTDGTNVLIGHCSDGGTLYLRTYNPTTGAKTATVSSENFKNDVTGAFRGSADFGMARTVVSRPSSYQFRVGGTDLAYDGSRSWDGPSAAEVAGFCWTGTRFASIGADGKITEYADINTGDASGDWWAVYAWAEDWDDNGITETWSRISPPKRFTWPRRAGIKFIGQPLPDGVQMILPAIAKKTTFPTRTDFHSPTWSFSEGRPVAWYDELPTDWDSRPSPRDNNNFPDAEVSVIESASGTFHVDGAGSGWWGPLTFNGTTMTGIPKMAAGKGETVTVTSGGFNTKTVSFPAGRFTSPPAVTVSADSTSAELINVNPLTITKDGFTLSVRRTNNTPTTVDWIAMEVS